MKMSKWSEKKVKLGIKKITARSRPFPNDPDVLFVFSIPIPLWIIKKYFYIEEGADSPEELQRKINGIWRRKVSEDRLLYIHILKPKGELKK
ncbi:MAG: hypothetical protein GTN40_02600 [Candidatus Aenigmarchaeota archaeon]|nr:hypothetical protein [Candidatus Aenigmarchaeota archaeon]